MDSQERHMNIYGDGGDKNNQSVVEEGVWATYRRQMTHEKQDEPIEEIKYMGSHKSDRGCELYMRLEGIALSDGIYYLNELKQIMRVYSGNKWCDAVIIPIGKLSADIYCECGKWHRIYVRSI
jgi:hypothetical protein